MQQPTEERRTSTSPLLPPLLWLLPVLLTIGVYVHPVVTHLSPDAANYRPTENPVEVPLPPVGVQVRMQVIIIILFLLLLSPLLSP